MTDNPMKSLRKRLTSAGIRKVQLDKLVLPDWWDDEIATSQAGFAQCAMIISRHLNLPIALLMNSNADILPSDLGSFKFKTRDNVQEDEIGEARLFISQVARITVKAMQHKPLEISTESPAHIREQILQNGAPWVGLSQLLDYCWQLGIPVLHISAQLNPKKPDGAAVMVDGRPVIVVCRNEKHSAWLLFTLAHELGHILLRHVDGNGMLVDEKVSEEDIDTDEKAANKYAVELLTGRSVCHISTPQLPKAQELAKSAQVYGRNNKIDPGHVVLNIAHTLITKDPNKTFYPLVNAALNIIEPVADAPAMIREKMEQQLPWDEISEESGEFIRRLTGSERCFAAAV